MQVCIGTLHDKPVLLELRNGILHIDGQEQPIKNIGEEDLRLFQEEIASLPKNDDPGYEALVNAVRASFIVKLLENAVGDDCVNLLTHILDHVHYDVLKYLGEVEED